MNRQTKRVWKIPVEDCEAVKNKRGRITYLPKKLSVVEGIEKTAIPVLLCYLIIIIELANICAKVIIKNPVNITLPTHFGLVNKTFSTPILMIMMYVSQLYLIYLDLIRRSRTKTLLVVPGLFFMVLFMILKPLIF